MSEEHLCQELNNACRNGNRSYVGKLLASGADPNKVYHPRLWDAGNTHLMTAVIWGHIEIIEDLINRGSDLDATNRDGYTALMLSTWDFDHDSDERITSEMVKMVRFLIRSGCPTDISVRGRTFLDDLPEDMRIEMEDFIDSLVPKPVKKKKEKEIR